jgi:hypothetical protein
VKTEKYSKIILHVDMKVYLPELCRGKSRGNVYMQCVGGESKQKLEKTQKAMD